MSTTAGRGIRIPILGQTAGVAVGGSWAVRVESVSEPDARHSGTSSTKPLLSPQIAMLP
jgi:hypothetical protein